MTKNERDFNNFLLTPDDMTFAGELDSPVIKGIVMKDLKAPLMREFHTISKLSAKERAITTVHFFTADFLFERVWYHPRQNLELLKQFNAVLTPDFSQYTDMPRAMAIWNHYRKMWLGAWWQSQGLRVIPTVTWSDEASFEYCFDGMPKNSLVAVSSVGCEKSVEARENFRKGYEKMLEVLSPKQIIFYGNKPSWLEESDSIVFVAPAYKQRFQTEDDK